jgi:Ca-activated chloride channel homolog
MRESMSRTTLLVLAVGALVATPAAQSVFRTTADPLVRVGITVLAKDGSFVNGLEAKRFEIREDGVRQNVRFFTHGDRGAEVGYPMHVGLLLDTSGSMFDDLAFARTASIKFLKLLVETEDVTLVDFDTEVRVSRYGVSDFARLVERIRKRKPDGWTALYDALGIYLHGAADQDGDKVLVMYTDGGDTTSSMTFNEAVDLVRASDATIYAIGLLDHQPQSTRMEQRLRLTQIALESGGQAYFPSSAKQLDDIYAQVLAEIRARYIVGYVSTNRRDDGAWRHVGVTINGETRGLKIRARKGYFALFRPSNSAAAPAGPRSGN